MRASALSFLVLVACPGWVSEAANQCFAFQSNRIAFGQTLTPRHLRLVDLDGDGVEEIRLQGSLAADVSVTAGTVFRCFDYQGQVVEAGCEP